MSFKAHDIRTYGFKSEDKLFFDANIWMFIHGPYSKPGRTQAYSNALPKISNAGSSIHVNAMILSEFTNRYARLEQQSTVGASKNFKVYRSSPEFKAVAPIIAGGVERILRMCQVVESGFTIIDKKPFLNRLQTGNYDFNDLVIAELCRNNNYILVTHDGDYRGFDVEVLTSNPALLR